MAKKQAEVEINKKKESKKKEKKKEGGKSLSPVIIPLTDKAFCAHALPLDRAQTLHHCRQPGGYPS